MYVELGQMKQKGKMWKGRKVNVDILIRKGYICSYIYMIYKYINYI